MAPRAGLARPPGGGVRAVRRRASATPGVAIILLFGAVPVVWSAMMSFQRNNLLTPSTPFVGLKNYRQLVHDPIVGQAIPHTLVYTALFVPGTMIVGLFLAVAMNRKIRFIMVYRTAAYATMAISTISEAIVFILAVRPLLRDRQLLPQLLRRPAAAVPGLLVPGAVRDRDHDDLGVDRVLRGHLPRRAAGRAGGAARGGAWTGTARPTFRRVTLPLLSPASLFLAVWLTINALQLFDEVYLSTQGGPLKATTVLVYYVYQQAFVEFNFGYASAIAYFLFLIILAVTAIQSGPAAGSPTTGHDVTGARPRWGAVPRRRRRLARPAPQAAAVQPVAPGPDLG